MNSFCYFEKEKLTETISLRNRERETWSDSNYDEHSEAKKIIEEQVKADYFSRNSYKPDTSHPRTITSGSIQTLRVSPLVKRPPRGQFRAPSEPTTPARSIPTLPLGPLPPLPFLTYSPLPPLPTLAPISSPVSPLRPLPALAPLPPPLSPLPLLPTLIPIHPLRPFVPINRYISPNYLSEETEVTSSSFKPIEDPDIKNPDLTSYYGPSTSSSSRPKLAQSSSRYVDCPSIYSTEVRPYSTRVDESNNNNNNEGPYDYSYETLTQWDA